MFKNIKKDWWFWNSIFWALSGLLIIIDYFIAGNLLVGLFSGGINILLGYALFQRSLLAYRLVLILASITFLQQILRLTDISKQTGSFSVDLIFIISVVILVLAIMLWQQVKNSKSKS